MLNTIVITDLSSVGVIGPSGCKGLEAFKRATVGHKLKNLALLGLALARRGTTQCADSAMKRRLLGFPIMVQRKANVLIEGVDDVASSMFTDGQSNRQRRHLRIGRLGAPERDPTTLKTSKISL